MNRRQASRLRQLSDYLHASRRLFMFELLVPPNTAQLNRLGNDKNAYDVQLRPALTVQAIHELQDSGVEADVWEIEGFERKEDCQRVVAAVRRVGRDMVGCIILGRHEDEQTVRRWLLVAAGVPGYIGFAVGRTTFWDVACRLPRPQDHCATRQLRRSPLPTASGWTCSRRRSGDRGRDRLSWQKAEGDEDLSQRGQACLTRVKHHGFRP